MFLKVTRLLRHEQMTETSISSSFLENVIFGSWTSKKMSLLLTYDTFVSKLGITLVHQ